jgi:hypothetical protein
VSGQLDALAALIPRKKPLVSIGQEAGWVPEPEKYLNIFEKHKRYS